MRKLILFNVGYWKQYRDRYDNFSETVLANSTEDAKVKLLNIEPSAKLLTVMKL